MKNDLTYFFLVENRRPQAIQQVPTKCGSDHGIDPRQLAPLHDHQNALNLTTTAAFALSVAVLKVSSPNRNTSKVYGCEVRSTLLSSDEFNQTPPKRL